MADLRAERGLGRRSYRNRTFGMWLVLFTVLGAALGVSLWKGSHVVLDAAPPFTLTSTGYEGGVEGEPIGFALEDYRGKTVVLDMMAVLCTSCRTLTKEVLLPLQERYGDHPDFELVSIDVWADPRSNNSSPAETREELVALQEKEGAHWRHALDTDHVWRKYSATSIPQVFIVDPDGRLVYQRSGVPDLDEVDRAVRISMAGGAEPVAVLQVGLVGAAFIAGVASFFSPCSVGLIPAYMGFLLHNRPAAARARATLRGGLLTGAGIVTVYAAFAAVLWGLSAAGHGPWLRSRLPLLVPVMGGALVAMGLLMLAGVRWQGLARRLGLGRLDGRRGFYVFGLGYGVAAFGCTGPLLLPILIAGFVTGPAVGLVALGAYVLAVVGLVVYAAALVAGGEGPRLQRVLGHTRAIAALSALLLIGAGTYLVMFDVRAGAIA